MPQAGHRREVRCWPTAAQALRPVSARCGRWITLSSVGASTKSCLVIADLTPIDHDPHRLAVTVYHHEVEGRRGGVILEGLRQRVRVVSLVEPHRQHAAIWADGTKGVQGCFVPISMQWLNAF